MLNNGIRLKKKNNRMSTFLNYLRNSHHKVLANPVGDILVAGVRVSIEQPVIDDVDVAGCFTHVLEKMPEIFKRNVRQARIGQFAFLKSREVEAVYKNGTIYLTSNHESNASLISDLVHEIAHAFEEGNFAEIYGDELIKDEFLAKRKRLFLSLESLGLLEYPISEQDFEETEYSKRFDEYLHETVGYEKLQTITNGIFVSPYAATCLREYFANAFENFFINDISLVKKISPNIYNKLMFFLEF